VRELIPVLIVLACPLLMLLLMRGGRHGHGAHPSGRAPLAELKRARDELNEEIARRAKLHAGTRRDRGGETT
jgi:hypothetical protein